LPVTLVALVTKKLNDGPEGIVGVLSSLHAAALSTTVSIRERLIVFHLLEAGFSGLRRRLADEGSRDPLRKCDAIEPPGRFERRTAG